MTRLTVAQALVRFLAAQYSERDGVETPALRRLLRHLRPRQRRRRRPGAARAQTPSDGDRRRALLPLPPGPQRAGHGARRRRLRPDAQPALDLGLHRLDRPGRDQHGHRRRAGHDQPAARCCCCPATCSRPGSPTPCCRSWRTRGRYDVSVNDAFRPVSRFFDRIRRPEQLPLGAAGRDAGAHRPGRDRRGDAGAAAGRAGRGVRLAGRAVRPRVWHVRAGRCPSPPRSPAPSR